MCQYSATDGLPNDWHFVHLGSRAVGGAGIIITEATAVEPAGRITPNDLGLWNEKQERALARIASFVNAQGAVAGLQLAHAGRKASHGRPWEDRRPLTPAHGGWEVVGPSPIPWEPDDLMPRELTSADIARLVELFQAAASRALKAGFRLLEIHAALGYLFHSFLSPVSNRRTDSYGGNLRARAKFLLQTIRAVREVWPAELPLFVRLSVTDYLEGGWDLPDAVQLVKLFSKEDVDLIDCSSGGTSSQQKVTPAPGYQVPYAETIKRETGFRTGAVGLVGEPKFAEAILERNAADLVIIGRMALWDAYWPHHAAKALGAKVNLPVQYARADIF